MKRRFARQVSATLIAVSSLFSIVRAQVPAGDPFPARPGWPAKSPAGYAPGSTRRMPPSNRPQPAVATAPAPTEPSPFQAPANPAALPPTREAPASRYASNIDESFELPTKTANAVGAHDHGRPGPAQLEGPQSPALIIEKVAPTEVQVGKTATIEIHVRNTGVAAAEQVTVHDHVPHGAQLVETRPRAERGVSGELVWRVGLIKPGEDLVLYVDLMPMTEGELGSVATVQFAASASSRSRSTRPALSVDVAAPEEVLIGETAKLKITISNPGTGVATGVVLVNQVPKTLEHEAGDEIEYEVGSLAPGESRTLELTMRAVRAGASANVLVARADGQLQADCQTAMNVVAPALEVALQGSRKRFLDRQATYTVTVANPGTAAAQEVELVAYLPPGLEFVDANNQGQFDRRTRAVHWSLEELPAREQGSVSLTVLPIEAGAQPVKISGTAQRGLAVEKPESIVVEGVSALLFQVADVADPVELGGETTYEIRVVNQGSKSAANVQVLAVLPAEMKVVGCDGPTRFEVVGSQVRFQPLPSLAPKADTTYRIRAQCQAAGDLRVRVQLTSDEIRAPITKEESTRVFADE